MAGGQEPLPFQEQRTQADAGAMFPLQRAGLGNRGGTFFVFGMAQLVVIKKSNLKVTTITKNKRI